MLVDEIADQMKAPTPLRMRANSILPELLLVILYFLFGIWLGAQL